MYVDGFLVPVLKDRIDDYKAIARKMGNIWIEHGALSVVEAMADDVPDGTHTSFPMAVKLTPDEVVVFSWITYRDRAHRDAVNAKVMADPRATWDHEAPPMNMQRMMWGGFSPIVNLSAAAAA